MIRTTWTRGFWLALVLAGAAAGRADEAPPPRFEGLGPSGRTITTKSPEAQRWFDQGLGFYWGFHHEEAIRSFDAALRYDPTCAMAYWGKALSLGPNINNTAMDAAASEAAWDNVRGAVEQSGKCSPTERDLIRALATRYADPAPEDRSTLDRAYADAMRAVYEAHSDDADVAALFAESLMDLRPWDLWSSNGEPRPETPEILSTLEAGLRLRPDHPGLNHFYVHSCEASPEPGRALAAADRLRNLCPGAGHLVHMPSHIDIRLGHYDDAIVANQRAVAADLDYLAKGGVSGFYTLYRAHNYHYIAYASMFAGRKATAMQAARDLTQQLHPDVVRRYRDVLDGFLATPVHVMIRFGQWEELLAEPAPPDDVPVTAAFWRYGRTVALAALGRVEEGAAELAKLREAAERVPETAYIGNNPARVVLDVGLPFAEGELTYRRGNVERAFELLRIAVERDDALKYDEPWGWMEPVRHALGALLLEQGRLEEAEAVYREDLRIHPNNGWALHGLAECLRRSGRAEEAARTEGLFRVAWKDADVVIAASCYCRKS
ncbi:MAG: tetratricopeptide repeat protein [Candidatus Eiseniibacteriota bacterium]